MIYKFVFGFAFSFLLATNISSHLPELGLNLFSSLNTVFPAGLQGVMLLLLRVSVGILFLLHGYPKITHLRQWADSLKMPIFLCFLSAASMLGGGICLILGLLTLLASLKLAKSVSNPKIRQIPPPNIDAADRKQRNIGIFKESAHCRRCVILG